MIPILSGMGGFGWDFLDMLHSIIQINQENAPFLEGSI